MAGTGSISDSVHRRAREKDRERARDKRAGQSERARRESKCEETRMSGGKRASGEEAPSFTPTHCNTLQHAATHCNILQHKEGFGVRVLRPPGRGGKENERLDSD